MSLRLISLISSFSGPDHAMFEQQKLEQLSLFEISFSHFRYTVVFNDLEQSKAREFSTEVIVQVMDFRPVRICRHN